MGQPALAGLQPVRAGDVQDVQPEVLAEIGAGDALILPVHADVAVEHQVRAQRPGVPDAHDVDLRVAEAALVEAEAEVVDDLRPEHARLEPDVVRGRPLEAQLRVEIVAVVPHLAQKDVIVGQPVQVQIGVGVRGRVDAQELLPDGADHVRWDDAVREFRAPGPARTAGARVVQVKARVGPVHLAEITVPHLRGGHAVLVLEAATTRVAFPAAEEEQLVLDDRPADRAPVDAGRDWRLGQTERVVGERVRVELVLVAEEEGRAVKLIRPGLGHHRDRGAPGHALVGVEVVGGDVDDLDRLRGLDVAHVMREPDVDRDRAVDAEGVVVPRRPVDAGGQRAAGGVDLCVLELRGRGSWHEVEQRLIVPKLVQRKVRHFLRREFGMKVGLLRLEKGGLRGHGDGFGQRSDLQPEIHADGITGGNADAVLA